MQVFWRSLLASVVLALLVASCRFTNDAQSLAINIDYPIVYVKRPQSSLGSAVDGKLNVIGSDLYLRDLSSPDAREINLTHPLTLGLGMVADPDVSFDGNKIVFSMKCSADSAPQCNSDTTWNMWIYDRRDGSLTPAIYDFEVANKADDLDPAFLPDGRIVFSSTRQQGTFEKTGLYYSIDNQQDPASVLHILDTSTQTIRIEQISFNRSHDRNPSVLQNGKIVFSHWLHEDDRSQVVLYTVNPDGTDMNVLYGAHSPGDAFTNPRELPDGKLLATVMPLTGTWEGGALMEMDVTNYSDADAPAPDVQDKSVKGQQPASLQIIPLDNSTSKQGRFTTPFPLFDGSNQVLVSYSFFHSMSDTQPDKEAPPSYGIFLLDLNDKSLKPVILPEDGMVLTDPVAMYPRTVPAIISRQTPDNPKLFDQTNPQGIIDVKSVYDTDRFGRMGEGVLTVNENATDPIPLTAPFDPTQDTRVLVADLMKLKDPLLSTANDRPARFVRVIRVKPTPPGLSPLVVGETNFDLTGIVGYAPIEPDGSFKIKVPADVPLSISVLDKFGRAYENHISWLQVRPGETLTCNGCHSPQRTLPLNRAPIAGAHPDTNLRNSFGQFLQASPLVNETMAETRTRADISALELTSDLTYNDVWTDTTLRAADSPLSYNYQTLQTTVPVNGVINYPDNIQPLWDLTRNINGVNRSCSSCHNGIQDQTNNPTGLNLTAVVSGAGRATSYDALMKSQVVYDENNMPYFETVDGVLQLRKGLPLVKAGYARGSHLIEVLFNQELFAEKALTANRLDHSGFLSDAEKRLVVEWVDIGAQYYNDPYDKTTGELVTLGNTLDYGYYSGQLHSQFIETCAICHSPWAIDKQTRNDGYVRTSFDLLRDPQKDFASVVSMVSDLQNPTNSYILSFPSDASGVHNKNKNQPGLPAAAYMPVNGTFYNKVLQWIQGTAQ